MTGLSGIRYNGYENNFERDFVETVAELKNIPSDPDDFPYMFMAMCGENGKAYLYNINNTVDATLGRWREIVTVNNEGQISVGGEGSDPNDPNAGNDPIQLGTKQPVILTQAEYDALYATKDDPDTEYDPEVIYLIKEA